MGENVSKKSICIKYLGVVIYWKMHGENRVDLEAVSIDKIDDCTRSEFHLILLLTRRCIHVLG
jgi:hypothetical protein